MARPCTCDRMKPGKPYDTDQCRLCWLYHNDTQYQELWDSNRVQSTQRGYCRHLGLTLRDEAGEVVLRDCETCPGKNVKLKVFRCQHPDQESRDRHALPTLVDCSTCSDFVPLPESSEPPEQATPMRTIDDPNSATPLLSVTDMVRLIERAPPGPWPTEQKYHQGKWTDVPEKCWHCWPNVQEAHRLLAKRWMTEESPFYPGHYSGRGIVIAGGGPKYTPSAWVNVCKLRHLGCKLPIELWYLGDAEMDPYTERLFGDLGVKCINAREVERTIPARVLCGWELRCMRRPSHRSKRCCSWMPTTPL
jgi:Mannosyltransferase putative